MSTAGLIKLTDGEYTVQWFNPRTEGELVNGSKEKITGGKSSTGTPPVDDGKDWVCLIKHFRQPVY